MLHITEYTLNLKNKIMKAKEFLHSDEINEWDTIFDPGGKQEYTEEQLIRFAEIWLEKDKISDESISMYLKENLDEPIMPNHIDRITGKSK
tara:strand:+ start:215 stop:487 length:273 start_codon:yes stop_codon:yes gene_type:complete